MVTVAVGWTTDKEKRGIIFVGLGFFQAFLEDLLNQSRPFKIIRIKKAYKFAPVIVPMSFFELALLLAGFSFASFLRLVNFPIFPSSTTLLSEVVEVHATPNNTAHTIKKSKSVSRFQNIS